ncbi:hypothetical protein WA588_002096, partial [Blastocystis sp. NMH]
MEDKSDSTRPKDTSPFPQKDTTEFSTEYKRDLEACTDYVNGGVLDSDNRRYDEILNPLVEEENQMRQEGFKKLNLPEEELLKTETNRDVFPENNKPAEPNIKIDKEAVSGTLKTAGRGISSGAKKVFAKVSEFRRRQVE